jgi:hypothetical protein
MATPAVLLLITLVYGLLGGGLGLVALSKTPRFGFYLLAAVAAFLNLQYGLWDVSYPISFFIALYDPGHSLFLDPAELDLTPGLSRCSENACTQLPDYYTHHPSWASDFFDRFVLGDVVRRAKLYVHVWANTFALGLGLLQLHPTLRKSNPQFHRACGYVATLLTLIGTAHAVMLGLEHGEVGFVGELPTF